MSSKLFYLLLLFLIPILFVQNSKKPNHNNMVNKIENNSMNNNLMDSLQKIVMQFDSTKTESKLKIRILHYQNEQLKSISDVQNSN